MDCFFGDNCYWSGVNIWIFFASPIGAIVSALVSVVTFVGINSYGFYKADKNNSTTTEFGNTGFVTKSQNTSYLRLKQIFNSILSLFSRKLVNTAVTPFSVVNDHHSVETEQDIPTRNIATNQNLSTNRFSPEIEKTLDLDKVPFSPALRI